MILDKVLKDLLHKSDITITQFARRTKVPRQTLDNWVAGQEPRSLKQVKLVAEYFDITVDYLCFGDRNIEDFGNEINAEVVLRRVKK